MEDFRWLSWTISIGLTAWVWADSKRRSDKRWGLWVFLAFFFPWVFGPAYYFFLRGKPAQIITLLTTPVEEARAIKGKQKRSGQSRGALSRAEQIDQDALIDQTANRIAAASRAERAEIVRDIGREWADAVGADTKAGGLAVVRVLIEAVAAATGRGEIARAQEQMDKALSHVRGGARRHPGGRMILEGLARVAGEAEAPPVAERVVPQPRPSVGPVEPQPIIRQAAPAPREHQDAPAFITARKSGPLAAAPLPAAPRHDTPPAEAPASAERKPLPRPAAVPITTLDPELARRFLEEPLDEFSARVGELATRWLAEVGDRAPSVQRSYARVKLESAASAVFRGDFMRASEMAEAAAELVPADVEAAATLRAGLRCAREARGL